MNAIAIIKLAMERKAAGVDYVPRKGAACPVCGRKRCRAYRVMPAEGLPRVRYHVCPVCKTRFKSVQA